MVTVGLPVYNQTEILSLALMGLASQKTEETWELIICTENDVENVVDLFREDLKKSGCVKIVIDKLFEWIPLPQKWRRIGQQMDPKSSGMILQAADCYPHRDRITQSAYAMSLGFDWYHEKKGYFYDINSGKMALFDGDFCPPNSTYLNMCIADKHVRDLPLSNKRKSIDRWLFKGIENPKVYTFEGPAMGVDIHGKNWISARRGKKINTYQPPFFKSSVGIKSIINFDNYGDKAYKI